MNWFVYVFQSCICLFGCVCVNVWEIECWPNREFLESVFVREKGITQMNERERRIDKRKRGNKGGWGREDRDMEKWMDSVDEVTWSTWSASYWIWTSRPCRLGRVTHLLHIPLSLSDLRTCESGDATSSISLPFATILQPFPTVRLSSLPPSRLGTGRGTPVCSVWGNTSFWEEFPRNRLWDFIRERSVKVSVDKVAFRVRTNQASAVGEGTGNF